MNKRDFLKQHLDQVRMCKFKDNLGHPLHLNGGFQGLVKLMEESADLLEEFDKYLDTNKMTTIGHSSILHRKFREYSSKPGPELSGIL